MPSQKENILQKTIQELPEHFLPNDLVQIPRLLTAQEVCNFLRISRMQLSRFVKSGKIRACKFGTKRTCAIRFLVNELLEDIENFRIGGSHE